MEPLFYFWKRNYGVLQERYEFAKEERQLVQDAEVHKEKYCFAKWRFLSGKMFRLTRENRSNILKKCNDAILTKSASIRKRESY